MVVGSCGLAKFVESYKDYFNPSPALDKVKRVALRILLSPLFWTATLTAFSFSAGWYSFAAALSLACICRKSVIYEASILPTVFFHYLNPAKNPWSNQILSEKLTLSAIPCHNMGHHKHSVNRAVLTMLEDHELRPSLFTEPVRPGEWSKQGVTQRIIAAPDFKGVEIAHIQNGVQFVHEQIRAEKRSWSIAKLAAAGAQASSSATCSCMATSTASS